MTPPILLHVFSTFSVGGPQVRFAAIANHFGPRWRHMVVAMDGNLACRERLAPGLDVSFPAIDFHKGDTLGNVRRFRQVLRNQRPQTLITNNWGTIEWAMANAILPVVRHVHIEDGFGPEERNMQIRRRVLTRRLVLRGATVVLPSRTLLRVATEIWRLPSSGLRYVPNGIDTQRFDVLGTGAGDQLRATSGAPPVVGTVAALRPEKNLGRLIRAFALAGADTPGNLVIVGDGAERPALAALAVSLNLGDRVHFAGHMGEPRHAYGGFDIFALSSDTEQMPLTVLEAMAAGLPVAATDVGDVRAMLAPESQPFVTALDDAALAASLRSLLRDPAARAAAGQANRDRAVAEYSQDRMFAAYAALFDGAGDISPSRLV
jgi:glycosyltransferase involved in cell wall biosynthesis